MTRAKRISIRLRWILLILWLLCLAAGIAWLLSPCFDWGAGLIGTPVYVLWPLLLDAFVETQWGYYSLVLVYLGLFFFTLWFFLGPRTLWKISITETPRPMKKAAVAAAFAAALLSAGFVYSILDLFFLTMPDEPSTLIDFLVISIPLILWLLWSLVFCLYLRQQDYYTWAGRIIRALIAGSILELFVSIPIYVTREEECYCARASYTGLVFGATALLWAFGPGVFLLFLREKHRIEKLTSAPQQQPTPPI